MSRVYGSRYVAGRDVVEIAKLVRADIKEAVRLGRLPKGRYSVTIDRYSMGRSIDVRFSPTEDFLVYNPLRLAFEAKTPYGNMHAPDVDPEVRWLYSVRAREAIAIVEAILAAHNHDGSDSQTDYHDVHFAAHVTIDGGDARREREIARLPALAARKLHLLPPVSEPETEPEPNAQELFLAHLGATS